MFGLFDHTHENKWTIACKHCGYRIGFEHWVPEKIYCPNCWELLSMPKLPNPKPHKYNPETGKLIEFNSTVLREMAEAAVTKEQEKLKSDPNTELNQDELIKAYNTSLKLGKAFGNFLGSIDAEDISISKKILDDYIALKREIRKERGLKPIEESVEEPAEESKDENS